MSDQAIEKEIQAKGLTAPRVTPSQIDSLMSRITVHTHHFTGTTTIVAAAFLENGFSISTGISACASPENFDAEIGVKIATKNALEKAREELWRMEGYALKVRLQKQSEIHPTYFVQHPDGSYSEAEPQPLY